MKMRKRIKILLVEDNPENLRVAQDYFNQKKDIVVDYATDFNQAMGKLKNKRYDGLITDLFMPDKKRAERDFFLLKNLYLKIYNKIHQDFEKEIAKGEKANSSILRELDYKLNCCYELRDEIFLNKKNAPLGILIAEKAEEMKIPYVIATSLYHHNHLAEPVFYYCYKYLKNCEIEEGDIITGGEGENLKLKREYWEKVFTRLITRLNKKNKQNEVNNNEKF
jgi:CheY-like chemotaxis protein